MTFLKRKTPGQQLAGDVVFTPPEASSLALELVEQIAKDPDAGVPLYLPGVDGYFTRMRPGNLVTVIGRPSNYKSGLMQYVARHEAMRLYKAKRDISEYVAYVTWEQSVEEMVIIELASQSGGAISVSDLVAGKVTDTEALRFAAIQRGAMPLWIIGHSNQRRRRRPRLSMTDVANAFIFIEDEWGKKPSLICLDYLQRIRSEGNREMRLHMMDCVDRAKDMAHAMGCPVMLGVQARREVDTRAIKLPLMSDGQETSNVEQTSDKVLSVWMPKTSEPAGSTLPAAMNLNIRVSPNLLMLQVLKQKLGEGGRTFAMYVDPKSNKIGRITNMDDHYYTEGEQPVAPGSPAPIHL